MNYQAPDEISMRSALYKPENLAGMEPFLLYVAILFAGMLTLVFPSQFSWLVAGLIVTVGLRWIRYIGKRDLQWSSVFIRSKFNTKSYYPAHSYANIRRPKMRKQQRDKRHT